MIPASHIPYLSARPNTLLLRRLEMPVRRGLIVIPDGFNTTTRSNEAVVLSAGEGCRFREGQVLFLSPSVSRHFELADRTAVWVCGEGEVMAVITDQEGLQTPVDLSVSPSHQMVESGLREELRQRGARTEVVEGDPRGKR